MFLAKKYDTVILREINDKNSDIDDFTTFIADITKSFIKRTYK